MKLSVMLKVAGGFLALGMGAVGLLLPVWPTTPFVLIAIACFSSTPKLQRWLLKVKIFKEYHESYSAGAGLSKATVMKSLCFLWIALIVSMVIVSKIWITVLLAGIGAAVTAHILYIAKPRGKKCGTGACP